MKLSTIRLLMALERLTIPLFAFSYLFRKTHSLELNQKLFTKSTGRKVQNSGGYLPRRSVNIHHSY